MGVTDFSKDKTGAIRAFKCNKVDVLDKPADKKAAD
jgi:hypothetical protein